MLAYKHLLYLNSFITELRLSSMKKIALSLSLIYVLSNCSTVPITGRKQTTWIPSGELISMSFAQYNQVLEESKLSTNQRQVNMVKTVGEKIKVATEKYMTELGYADKLEGYQWEFNLIENKQVNAWAMPGGKVAFYTGIMDICKDEKGVAVVMGHEISHALASHGNERMTHGLIQQAGGVALAVALREKPAETQALFMASYGVASTVGGMLPFSRKQESEADEIGLILMAIAGYDPSEAPKFWERMQAVSGGQAPPEFLSTHPSHETRIKKLNRLMPKAMKYYNDNN